MNSKPNDTRREDVAQPGAVRTAKILVIDDERGIREGCRRVLQAEGYGVSTAEDGETGRRLSSSGGFDLLLVDVKLPGVDGIQLVREVHQLDPTLVCVMITGYATLDTAIRATKSGAYDILPKPFTPDELVAKVEKALSRRRLELETRRLREDRERSLLELSAEKSRLLTVINCMQDAVLVTNRDGQLVLFNPAALSLLQPSDGGSIGRAMDEVASIPEIGAQVTNALAAGQTDIMLTREISREDQRLMANTALITDETTAMLGSVTVIRDVTALRQLDTAKSQFIAMVSHEITSPLAAIQGYLDLLLTAPGIADPSIRQMLERSRERASGLLELIGDLLDVSTIDAGKVARRVESVAIPALIDEATEMVRERTRREGIELVVDVATTLPHARADREDLLRALNNLLTNAIKYNSPAGSVSVSAREEGPHVRIDVKDTGIGIPPECIPRLFDEFYRVKRPETRSIPGTGLGLTIVKRIVEAHHGRVIVASEPGQGSTFSIIMPAYDPPGLAKGA